MFIQKWMEQEERLKRARMALASVADYPLKVRRVEEPVRDHDWPRGVYELEIAARGYRAFNVVYSNGDITFHQFPAHRVTRALVRGLRRALDRDDPVTLKIVKPADFGPSFQPFPRGHILPR